MTRPMIRIGDIHLPAPDFLLRGGSGKTTTPLRLNALVPKLEALDAARVSTMKQVWAGSNLALDVNTDPGFLGSGGFRHFPWGVALPTASAVEVVAAKALAEAGERPAPVPHVAIPEEG